MIDITADQFDDAPGPIIVAKESEWHNQLQGCDVTDVRPISDFDKNCSFGEQKPPETYEVIALKVRERLKSKSLTVQ